MEFKLWLAALMFLLYIAYDYVYAIYYMYVAQKRPFMAANSAVTLYMLSSLATVIFLGNKLYLIPILLGSYIGTYIAVKYHPVKDKVVKRPQILAIEAEIAEVKSLLDQIPQDQVIDRLSFEGRLKKLEEDKKDLLNDSRLQ